MLQEFKKFALRGNVVDLAVGVIIGVAFGAIVTSIVADIIMPIIGAITGGLDFSNYYLPLSSKVQSGLSYVDAKKAGAVLGYGQFITVALNFIIVAFVLFLVIRAMNRLMRTEEAKTDVAKPVELPADVKLLAEIRDQMAALNKAVSARRAAPGDQPQKCAGAKYGATIQHSDLEILLVPAETMLSVSNWKTRRLYSATSCSEWPL